MAKTIRQKYMDTLKTCTDNEYSDDYLQPYADRCWGIYMRNSRVKAIKEQLKVLKRIRNGEPFSQVYAELEESLKTYTGIRDETEND